MYCTGTRTRQKDTASIHGCSSSSNSSSSSSTCFEKLLISNKYVRCLEFNCANYPWEVRKPVNKHSLWPWYVKLAKCVSSPRWSTYASNCQSSKYFSDNSGLRKETSVRQVVSTQNMHIETLTLDPLSRPQMHFPSPSVIINVGIIVQPCEEFRHDKHMGCSTKENKCGR